MEYYFKKFAEQKVQTESDPFVWLLYFLYCSLRDAENKLIEADRMVEIIENTMSDTISFGFGVVPPGNIGIRAYVRIDSSNQGIDWSQNVSSSYAL